MLTDFILIHHLLRAVGGGGSWRVSSVYAETIRDNAETIRDDAPSIRDNAKTIRGITETAQNPTDDIQINFIQKIISFLHETSTLYNKH